MSARIVAIRQAISRTRSSSWLAYLSVATTFAGAVFGGLAFSGSDGPTRILLVILFLNPIYAILTVYFFKKWDKIWYAHYYEQGRRRAAETLAEELRRQVEELAVQKPDTERTSETECTECDANYRRGVLDALEGAISRASDLGAQARSSPPELRIVKQLNDSDQ